MPSPTSFSSDCVFQGSVTFAGTVQTKFARAQLSQEALNPYGVPLTSMRVWDALSSLLPATAASDDLGITTGTWGTSAPTIRTSDGKNTTTTQRLAFLFVVPSEYDTGETVTLRISAGMVTTVASSSATVDAEIYELNKTGGLGGAPDDLVTTAATTINSLTKGNKDFTVTSSGLAPGDILIVRLTIAITDVATATAVIGEIGAVDMLLDVRG